MILYRLESLYSKDFPTATKSRSDLASQRRKDANNKISKKIAIAESLIQI